MLHPGPGPLRLRRRLPSRRRRQQTGVDSSDEAEASARDHRTVTHHVTMFTIGPGGETPA